MLRGQRGFQILLDMDSQALDTESQAFFWCVTWHMGAEIQIRDHDWKEGTLNYLATSSIQFLFIIFRMETKSY